MIKKIVIIASMIISLITMNTWNVEAKASGQKVKEFANVVLFAKFSDDKDDFFGNANNRQTILDIYNGTDGRSFTNYMKTISYNQFSVKNIFPQDDGNKIGAYTLPYTSNEAQSSDIDYSIINEIIKNIPSISNQVIDYDNDGIIDNLTIVLRGNDGERSNVTPTLYPHKAYYAGDEKWSNKKIGNYNILNTGRMMEGTLPEKSGLVAHEFLHSLGYPDLYTNDGKTNPVFCWDIMASSSQYVNYPLAYTRMRFSNWLSIDEITSSQTLTLDMQNNKDGNQAYILKSPLNEHEVFVIEFRKKTDSIKEDKLDSKIGDSGIIVYRVDTTVDGLSDYHGKTGIYVFRPQKGQTGYNESERISVNNAALSKESGKTTIGVSDLNKTLEDGALTYSDGSNSGIVISDVSSNAGNQMTCKVSIPENSLFDTWTNTQFDDNRQSDNKGCYMISNNNIQYLISYSNQQYSSYQYDGEKWEKFGNSISQKNNLQAQLFINNQELYFAYMNYNNNNEQLVLMKYNKVSNQWEQETLINDFGNSFQCESINGEIYLVYTTNEHAILGKIESHQLKILGNYFDGMGGQPEICQLNNQIYVSVRNASGNIIEVSQYKGNNEFTKVSDSSLAANTYDMISLGNKIYLSLGNTRTKMAIFDGQTWKIGKESSINSFSPELAVAQGNLYMLVTPNTGSGKTQVYSYDIKNDTYTQEGIDVDNASNYLNLSSSDNYLYIAYVESSQNQIKVKSKKVSNELLSLSITPPKIINYMQGQSVNTDGLKVVANYTKGSKELTNNDYKLTGFDTSTVGTKTATISYGGKSNTFNYTVNAKPVTLNSIKITKQPAKTTYYVGDKTDLGGLEVKGVYSDGSEKNIDSKDYTVTNFNTSAAGTKTATVTYN
ncbi:bacterial Ig-like domain-containing protein, partial [Candidatus Stoquefichus massiliensis]|uniref:bacterial Ig-like domain-containing protein n=1 Tax=Candidatus Stoquefichus massiliensis TaxID=1470350 RepID=UPI0005C9B27E